MRNQAIHSYDLAASHLPAHLRRPALQLPEEDRLLAEEFRLRVGQPMTILVGEEERVVDQVVSAEDLEAVCNLATEFSRYAAETLRDGYLPIRGGGRIGLCGTAVMKQGAVSNLKEFSSAAIRIAREHPGIAEPLLPQLFRDGRFCSTLILSPPGGGKTTLLRDLVRCLSDGVCNCPPSRIALVDERCEIAVSYRGEPQMDVGTRTDVLAGCPKAQGIPMVLRAMNPQIIAVDEITVREDLEAMVMASNCGVSLLATIHAGDAAELVNKPFYAQLLSSSVFRRLICIENHSGERSYHVEEVPC